MSESQELLSATLIRLAKAADEIIDGISKAVGDQADIFRKKNLDLERRIAMLESRPYPHSITFTNPVGPPVAGHVTIYQTGGKKKEPTTVLWGALNGEQFQLATKTGKPVTRELLESVGFIRRCDGANWGNVYIWNPREGVELRCEFNSNIRVPLQWAMHSGERLTRTPVQPKTDTTLHLLQAWYLMSKLRDVRKGGTAVKFNGLPVHGLTETFLVMIGFLPGIEHGKYIFRHGGVPIMTIEVTKETGNPGKFKFNSEIYQKINEKTIWTESGTLILLCDLVDILFPIYGGKNPRDTLNGGVVMTASGPMSKESEAKPQPAPELKTEETSESPRKTTGTGAIFTSQEFPDKITGEKAETVVMDFTKAATKAEYPVATRTGKRLTESDLESYGFSKMKILEGSVTAYEWKPRESVVLRCKISQEESGEWEWRMLYEKHQQYMKEPPFIPHSDFTLNLLQVWYLESRRRGESVGALFLGERKLTEEILVQHGFLKYPGTEELYLAVNGTPIANAKKDHPGSRSWTLSSGLIKDYTETHIENEYEVLQSLDFLVDVTLPAYQKAEADRRARHPGSSAVAFPIPHTSFHPTGTYKLSVSGEGIPQVILEPKRNDKPKEEGLAGGWISSDVPLRVAPKTGTYRLAMKDGVPVVILNPERKSNKEPEPGDDSPVELPGDHF